MATLVITVPDAVVTRIRAAYGHDSDTGRVSATVVEVQTALLNALKRVVKDYEGAAARAAAQATVDADVNAW